MTDAAVLPAALTPPKAIVNPWKPEDAVKAFMALGVPDADIVTHETIAALIGVPVDNPDATYGEVQKCQLKRVDRFERFRLLLLKTNSVYLKSLPGQGYVIVPPADQGFTANADLMRAISKEMRRAALIMAHTRVQAIPHYERARHAEAGVKLAGLEQMLKSVRKNFLKDDE